jgi:dienelactone hydrolase
MRWFPVALLAALTLPSALADPAVPADPARQALVSYLDSLAEPQLAARAAAMKTLHTRAAAERHQAELRKKVLALLGGLPDRSAPLNAQITGTVETGGLRIEKVVFDSLPGYRVTGDVFVPEGKGPFPAVIVSPGHGPAGKAGNYQFAVNFARAGFVVLSYDVVGAGERLQHFDPELNASRLDPPVWEHSLAAYQSMLLGQPVARFFINDAMRGIDYLQSRSDVDGDRIGAYGCSGGGTVTAFVAALDPRLKATATACFITTMHELLPNGGPQEGEQSIPGFTAAGLDLGDWVELAAPRAYAIVSTTEDMFPFAGAREVHDEALRYWGLYGAADKLKWITGPGRHGNLGPIAPDIIAFFVANLKGHAANPPVITARPERPEDLLVTPTGQLSNSIGTTTIQALVEAHAAEVAAKPGRIKDEKSLAALQDRLRRDIRAVTRAAAQPGSKAPAADAGKTEVRDGARLQSIHFRPSQGPAFDATLVTPDGAVKGRMLYLDHAPFAPQFGGKHKLDGLLKAGWQVLTLAPAEGPVEDNQTPLLGRDSTFAMRLLMVNRSLTGIRIDQAIAAADWLTAQGKGPLAIYGVGALGPVALHVAVLDKRFTTVVSNAAQATYRSSVDEPIARLLPEIAMPDVLLHYDLPDLLSALAPRRVVVIGPIDASGRSYRQAEFESVVAVTRQNDAALGLRGRVQWQAYEPSDLLAGP